MTKHTPGPWRLVHHGPQWSVCDTQGAAPNDGDHFIADLYRGLPRDAETVEANARLIAAAPEMLAALRLAHEAINPADRVDGGISLQEWSGRLNAASAVISQTIRKAEPE